MWDHRHKSIDFDVIGYLSMAERKGAREHQIWWNVCVDRASFVDWLKGEFPAKMESKAAVAEPTDDDARALIRAAIAKNGGFIGQNNGAKIVREKYPGFNKERAMALTKELTKNDKPGPRGPRNNCPQNCPAKIIAPDN